MSNRPASGLLCGRFDVPLLALAMAAVAMRPADMAAAQKKKKSFPDFAVIKKEVKQHFSAIRGHHPGDLLTRRDVAPLFAKLEKRGWKVADRKEILDRVLADTDFMVQQLRSRQGREFMRHLARLPGGYDRLDRLRSMPHGRRRLQELSRTPGGYKLIEYMTTSKGGRNLGRQLSRGKRGRNFNRPTGRLYTSKDVLARLAESYQAARKRRGAKSSVTRSLTDRKSVLPER